jgi:hypothetical protein
MMECEILNLRFLAGAYETLLDVIDARFASVTPEDVSARRGILGKSGEDASNSLTHGNNSRPAILALFYKEPAWEYFPDLPFHYS